jgi:hypothetical protein
VWRASTWGHLATAPFADAGLKVRGMSAYLRARQRGFDGVTLLAVDDSAYMRSADLDAVTKTNHFRKCAAATRDIPPNLACSFAGPEAEIRDLEMQGRLNLKSFVDTDYADMPCPDDDNIRECSSSLHCARPEAPAAAGPCDVHGMVGGVCSHSFPLRGVFVDMLCEARGNPFLMTGRWAAQPCP